MKIFLSYASEQSELAKEIVLALRSENHSVFFDRSSLDASESYNAKIREAVDHSQLFVFLISPHALAEGRYTLTELDFAERKWLKPSGHVLPVLVEPVPKADIPVYLRSVSILQPSGNIAAAVAAEVDRGNKSRWWKALRRHRPWLAALLVSALSGSGAFWWYQNTAAERESLGKLLNAAKIQLDTGHYEEAWAQMENAQALAPRNIKVQKKAVKAAMEWLENARVTEGKGSFAAIVDKVTPALSDCAAWPDKVWAADCLAHMGWGDFLKSKEGRGGLQPEQFYQRALALDPGNAYAHALWGFHILASNGSLPEADRHFRQALAGGRERPYVRKMQILALLYYNDERLEDEAIRVVNEMRRNSEPLPPEDRGYSIRWSKLWNIYYSRLLNGSEQPSFLSALEPADHLATFRWLFPEDRIPEDKKMLYRFFLGNFQELAGHPVVALESFKAVQKALPSAASGPLAENTAAAVTRLSKLNSTERRIRMR